LTSIGGGGSIIGGGMTGGGIPGGIPKGGGRAMLGNPGGGREKSMLTEGLVSTGAGGSPCFTG